jgi:hypothetical protein
MTLPVHVLGRYWESQAAIAERQRKLLQQPAFALSGKDIAKT